MYTSTRFHLTHEFSFHGVLLSGTDASCPLICIGRAVGLFCGLPGLTLLSMASKRASDAAVDSCLSDGEAATGLEACSRLCVIMRRVESNRRLRLRDEETAIILRLLSQKSIASQVLIEFRGLYSPGQVKVNPLDSRGPCWSILGIYMRREVLEAHIVLRKSLPSGGNKL